MNGLLKEEIAIVSKYIFNFIICIMLVLPYIQYLFFTADILLTAQQLNKFNLNTLKWLIYTFDILKILIILNFVLFIKYKKCGSLLVLLVGICMFIIWMYCILTQCSNRDDIVEFLNYYIFNNGVTTSLFVIISQVILFIVYNKAKKTLN